MGVSIRIRTLQAALTTFAVVHLIGIAEVVFTGWELSTNTGYRFTSAFAISVAIILFSRKWELIRGCALGMAGYMGLQTVAFWFTTPKPPTQGELIFGTLLGLALIIAVVLLEQWVRAAERAHNLSTTP